MARPYRGRFNATSSLLAHGRRWGTPNPPGGSVQPTVARDSEEAGALESEAEAETARAPNFQQVSGGTRIIVSKSSMPSGHVTATNSTRDDGDAAQLQALGSSNQSIEDNHSHPQPGQSPSPSPDCKYDSPDGATVKLNPQTVQRRLREARGLLEDFVAKNPRAMAQLSITNATELAQALVNAQPKRSLEEHYLKLLRERTDHRGRSGLLSAVGVYISEALNSTAFGQDLVQLIRYSLKMGRSKIDKLRMLLHPITANAPSGSFAGLSEYGLLLKVLYSSSWAEKRDREIFEKLGIPFLYNLADGAAFDIEAFLHHVMDIEWEPAPM